MCNFAAITALTEVLG